MSSGSEYIDREMENHPEPEYLSDLRILRRFVQNGSFGYSESKDEVFERLKTRYLHAYDAFGRERKRDVLEAYRTSPHIEEQEDEGIFPRPFHFTLCFVGSQVLPQHVARRVSRDTSLGVSRVHT